MHPKWGVGFKGQGPRIAAMPNPVLSVASSGTSAYIAFSRHQDKMKGPCLLQEDQDKVTFCKKKLIISSWGILYATTVGDGDSNPT